MTPIEAATRSFKRHRSSVERAAADVVRDPHEAKDLASDAFLALLEQGPEDEAVHLAWLRTTARNRALNRLRRLRRHVPLEDHDTAVNDREPLDGVRGLIAGALARLPGRDRDALVGRIVREESYHDLAARLGVPTERAHLIVHRASTRLRREVVRGLAAAHDASDLCTRVLIRRHVEGGAGGGHEGCSACLAVTEEVAALKTAAANLGVSPAMLPAAGMLGWLGDLVTRARAVIDRPRAQGAAAALALAVSLGPAVPPSSDHPEPPATIEAIATAPETAALLAGALSGLDGAAGAIEEALALTASELEDLSATRVDHPEDSVSLVPVVPAVASGAPTGNVLRVLTQAGTVSRPDVDVTALEIRTTYQGTSPDGLRFSVETVAEPLVHGGQFVLAYRFDPQSQCLAELNVRRAAGAAPTGTFLVSCRSSLLGPSEEQIPVAVAIDAERLSVEIPFKRLGKNGRALHHPGARLVGLLGWTSTSTVTGAPMLGHQDRVPEKGSVTYTVG